MGGWRGKVLALAGGAMVATTAADAAPALKIEGVEVVGTDLRIDLSDGRSLSGGALVGAVLGLSNETGAAMLVKIEAVTADPKDRTGEVFLYRFTTLDAAGRWLPVCSPDPDGRQLGIPQPGAGGKVEIWCTSGALGKCVRLGYHPWERLPDGTPLARHHRACVDVVRADYTGDGHPTIRDGMLIDVFDHAGVNAPDAGAGAMPFEAAWGEPLLFNRSRGDGIPGR